MDMGADLTLNIHRKNINPAGQSNIGMSQVDIILIYCLHIVVMYGSLY